MRIEDALNDSPPSKASFFLILSVQDSSGTVA